MSDPDRIWTWPYGGGISGDYRTTPHRPLDPVGGATGAVFLRATPRREAADDLYAALEHMIRWHDQLSPADIAKAETAITKARGQA